MPCDVQSLGSLTRDRTHSPCMARQILNHWTMRGVPRDLSLGPLYFTTWSRELCPCPSFCLSSANSLISKCWEGCFLSPQGVMSTLSSYCPPPCWQVLLFHIPLYWGPCKDEEKGVMKPMHFVQTLVGTVRPPTLPGFRELSECSSQDLDPLQEYILGKFKLDTLETRQRGKLLGLQNLL